MEYLKTYTKRNLKGVKGGKRLEGEGKESHKYSDFQLSTNHVSHERFKLWPSMTVKWKKMNISVLQIQLVESLCNSTPITVDL